MEKINKHEENAHPQKKNGLAMLSMIIGLIAVGLLFIEMKIGIALGMIGLVFSTLSLRSNRKKLAWISFILNGLTVFVPLILILYMFIEVLFLYSNI